MNSTLREVPNAYGRRVLFTVAGLSPQVLTETVYALAVRPERQDERFIPTEVHALTTTEGAQRIRLALLSDQPGGFRRLREDWALPPIALNHDNVHVVRNAEGHELADIRSEADNAAVADAITELIRGFTADPTCALHVSLAGGRKTMGYYAGYALSLFGREQDRLSHVLVNAPFESHPDFYYPTPTPQVINLPGGGWADASAAQVCLAPIPFVRLRQGLPNALLSGRSGFAATVAAASASLAPAEMTLDISHQVVVVDGNALHLTPMQFGLLAALAWRARTGKPALAAPARDAHDADWATELLGDLRAAVGLVHMPDGMEDSLHKDCSGAKVSPHFSRLRRRLAEVLAPGRSALYFDDGQTHRHRKYRVPLAADAIRFVDAIASLQQR